LDTLLSRETTGEVAGQARRLRFGLREPELEHDLERAGQAALAGDAIALDSSKEVFERALAADADLWEARFGLGIVARQRGDARMKRVVVVGGGFAGLHLVRHLEGHLREDEMDLTLVDRNNFHLFTPLLYQVATGELPPHAVACPLRVPLARKGWRFVRAEVEGIDLAARVARTSEGQFPYDHVVLVPGSGTNDFGVPGVKEHPLVVKWLTDGRALRHRILSVFEEAGAE